MRDDLNMRVPRVMCVARIRSRSCSRTIPEGQVEELDASYYPHDVPLTGSRKVPFSRELWIERDDFMEDPPKKFFRLAPGREVRLRYGYFITCTEVVKDDAGEIVELRCTYDPATRGGDAPDGRKVQGTIHWVSARARARLRAAALRQAVHGARSRGVGRRTRTSSTSLNPDSLVVVRGREDRAERARAIRPGTRYQFERTGYFVSDVADSSDERPVFNRTVTLRDTLGEDEGRLAAHDQRGRGVASVSPTATLMRSFPSSTGPA